jgi:AraC family transcriptional regulator, regulatory protein of adaptative response / DNA-3-methyladenine glycosylase II
MASLPLAAAYHGPMLSPATALDPDAAYRALAARDARFDGRFYVGVTSTGIYCRPVCRVKLPMARNCRFFAHAAGAEKAGFRPCLRCRPEQAPGWSLTDASANLARSGARLIEHAVANGEPVSMAAVAGRLGVTDRHWRRIFQAEFEVSPMDWLGTQRLLLAKRLLSDTRLPITEVALASGFASVRRFNAAFAQHYRLAPSALRKQSCGPSPSDVVQLSLPWRAPYDVLTMQRFLADRPLQGVEAWAHGQWSRTLSLPHQGQRLTGWCQLRFDEPAQAVQLRLSAGLAPALGAVLQRLRHLLDLDTATATIEAALHGLPCAVRAGVRQPGCVDGFETTVRIILGQQITVAAACTLAARLVQRFGEPLDTPVSGLTHLFPTPEALAQADPADIGTLGIVRARVAALQALARAVHCGALRLSPAEPVAATVAALQALPGIGPWTTELVSLRVLAWPDAFPASDAGVIRALGGLKAPHSTALSQAWRPWRSYAVMQLWHSLQPSPEHPVAVIAKTP